MSQQYRPHRPGEQPNKPERDRNGIQITVKPESGGRPESAPKGSQSFAAATDHECPPNMTYDPALGTCIADGGQ